MTEEKLQRVVAAMRERYAAQRMQTAYDPEGRKVGHIGHMLISLAQKPMDHDTKQRWLGYTQCLCVFYGLYNLDELRALNKD
jgi:hypothetical protein